MFAIALFIFALALVGMFYPYNRGALLSACVVLYALTAGIAGGCRVVLVQALGLLVGCRHRRWAQASTTGMAGVLGLHDLSLMLKCAVFRSCRSLLQASWGCLQNLWARLTGRQSHYQH
eukprot:scaffold47914_cov19-Tisochrysis_lutea.AAC.3